MLGTTDGDFRVRTAGTVTANVAFNGASKTFRLFANAIINGNFNVDEGTFNTNDGATTYNLTVGPVAATPRKWSGC